MAVWSLFLFIAIAPGLSPFTALAATDLYAAAGIQPAKREAIAPSFALRTVDGAMLESDALRGKVIVLNFWATWCGPCKEEMPAMQRLQEAFPVDLTLLAVTTDQQQDAITAFAKGLGLSFPILLDDTKDVSAAFGVRGLPTTVIIDRQGHLAGRAIGPRQWDGPHAMALLKDLLQ